jgi:serine protease Do
MKIVSGAAVACVATAVSLAGPALAHAQAPPPRAPERPAPFVFASPGAVLGVSVRDIDADEASKAKLPQAEGVLVADVTEGSAADHAGLEKGDVVVEFDGERVRSARQFTRLVQDTPPGRTVKAVVMRDGTRRTLDVTPEAPTRASIQLPDFSQLQENLGDLRFNIEGGPNRGRGRLGTALTPLTGQLADYFGVKRGVLVSSVDVNSPAARAGLKAGDVITGVNGHEVDTPADVRRELRDAGSGGKIDLSVTRDHKALTLSTSN